MKSKTSYKKKKKRVSRYYVKINKDGYRPKLGLYAIMGPLIAFSLLGSLLLFQRGYSGFKGFAVIGAFNFALAFCISFVYYLANIKVFFEDDFKMKDVLLTSFAAFVAVPVILLILKFNKLWISLFSVLVAVVVFWFHLLRVKNAYDSADKHLPKGYQFFALLNIALNGAIVYFCYTLLKDVWQEILDTGILNFDFSKLGL